MLAQPEQTDLDAGPRRAAGSERLCVVTREVKPVDDMIRFVVAPDRSIVADLKRKLPGRGVWVTARRDALVAASKRGVFARAFKADVTVAPDLPDAVDALLERSLLDALGVARKARQVITGYAKVEAAAEEAAAVAFLQASDAGPEGVRQIMAAIRRGYAEEAANIVIIRAFTSTQLDLALARPNVVHAALLAGRATDTVMARWRILARVRMVEPNRAHAIRPEQEAPGTGSE